MLQTTIFDVRLNVLDECPLESSIYHSFARFIADVETRNVFEQIRQDVLDQSGQAFVILGEGILLWNELSNKPSSELEFQAETYRNHEALIDKIHIALRQCTKYYLDHEFQGLRVYSPLSQERQDAILKPLLDLPMIEVDSETGLIREDMNNCPLRHALQTNEGLINTVYFVFPDPEVNSYSFIQKSVVIPGHDSLYEFQELLSVERAFEKYHNLKLREPRTMVIKTPTAGCLVYNCAIERQAEAYRLAYEEVRESSHLGSIR